MSNSRRKTTRVRVAKITTSEWFTHPTIELKKSQFIPRAKDLFGEPGVQWSRRWFYKTNYEHFYDRKQSDSGSWLMSYSRRRMFLHFYFKRPEDATWFQLKCMG